MLSALRKLNPLPALAGLLFRSLTVEQFRQLGIIGGGYDSAQLGERGPEVTRDNALGVSAVFCADRVISDDIGCSPIRIYDGPPDADEAEPIPGHPIAQLCTDPNPEQTGPVFWACVQHCVNIWGYGLVEIVRNGAGQPVQLWPLLPHDTTIERFAGRLRFRHNSGVTLESEEVLFFPGHSPDGTIGFSLLEIARTSFATAITCQRFMGARFRRGLYPSGAIEVVGELSDKARANMAASWDAIYSGPANAGRPLLLEAGAKWNPFELAHNDQLQLSQLAEYLVVEAARFFNISPVKLHQLGRATWGNLTELNRDHVHGCLGSRYARIAAEIRRKLLKPGESARHNTDRLLQSDPATRSAFYESALRSGWMTVDEVRRREDLPPLGRAARLGPDGKPLPPTPGATE